MLLKNKKILLAHSNTGEKMNKWHAKREAIVNAMGFKFSTFSMLDHHDYMIFPELDRRWRRRDKKLLKFYDALGQKIDESEIFIHFNGALIHPEFLEGFKCVKIYHCADDPDASSVLSKPVAFGYDIHAISNPAVLDMYKGWGCKNVFFWPLGGFHDEGFDLNMIGVDWIRNKEISLTFIGSKYGVTKHRFLHRIPIINMFDGIHKKKIFLDNVEKKFPYIAGYGYGWKNGYAKDENIASIYKQSLLGLNLHNSLGPINGRLYDLAAFSVCQICDNKKNLFHVFEEGREIVGFDTEKECFEKISYYLAHKNEAIEIAKAGHERYLRDYTTENIMKNFLSKVDILLKTIN